MEKQRIAIFASGSGSNAECLVRHFADSAIAEIAWVGCNRPATTAGIYARLKPLGIQVTQFSKAELHDGRLLERLQQARIEWVMLAGFLLQVPPSIIAAFPNRMLNVHPSLLPDFGGPGMFGKFVHAAVSESGKTETGISVHYVTEAYDEGEIIFQATCSIPAGEDPEKIAAHVQELEHQYIPKVLEHLIRESVNQVEWRS